MPIIKSLFTALDLFLRHLTPDVAPMSHINDVSPSSTQSLVLVFSIPRNLCHLKLESLAIF